MPRDHDFHNGVIIFYIIYNIINVGNVKWRTLMNVYCICLTVVKCFLCFFLVCHGHNENFGKNK